MSHTYDRNGLEYQSVTTILGAVAEKSFLIDWAARRGAETGDPIAHKKESCIALKVGSIVHDRIETYLSYLIASRNGASELS